MIKGSIQEEEDKTIVNIFTPNISVPQYIRQMLPYLVGQTIKNLPPVRGTSVQSLGWKDPLEKEMATYSGILAWEIPRAEETGSLQFMGLQRVGHN